MLMLYEVKSYISNKYIVILGEAETYRPTERTQTNRKL